MSRKPSAGDPNPLQDLRGALRRFADERDRDQFHYPRNLAIALSVEAAELLEHFQWMPKQRNHQAQVTIPRRSLPRRKP